MRTIAHILPLSQRNAKTNKPAPKLPPLRKKTHLKKNQSYPPKNPRKKQTKFPPPPEVRETMPYLLGVVLSKGYNGCISQKSCPSPTEVDFIIIK